MNIQIIVLEHGLKINGKEFHRWTQVRELSHTMMQLLHEYREQTDVSSYTLKTSYSSNQKCRRCPYQWFSWAMVLEVLL
jgi:hypothetical protein